MSIITKKRLKYTEVTYEYYLPSSPLLLDRLNEYMTLGNSIYEILLKHHDKLNKLPTGKYLKRARGYIYNLPSYNNFTYTVINTLLLTIHTYLKIPKLRGKKIYNWHIPIKLIPEPTKTPTTPITQYNQIAFLKFGVSEEDIYSNLYRDALLTKPVTINIRLALKYANVCVVDDTIAVSITVYTGTDEDTVTIIIPKGNKSYKALKNTANMYWLYANLLLNKIQDMTYSSIVKNKSYKKLYKILFNVIKTRYTSIDTVDTIIDNVCKDMYNEIVKTKTIPTTCMTPDKVGYWIRVYDIQYEKIITDMCTITNINSRIEALPYIDLEKAFITINRGVVYLIIPNKSNLREVEIDYI